MSRAAKEGSPWGEPLPAGAMQDPTISAPASAAGNPLLVGAMPGSERGLGGREGRGPGGMPSGPRAVGSQGSEQSRWKPQFRQTTLQCLSTTGPPQSSHRGSPPIPWARYWAARCR